eukprot:TRINITY_DN45394_c0_g1_i1.p2 TRINITY_DN45394_c0_g1~~TRINITY_DN45394_c0_g1_i1.p2  ORF type:complete len:140 (-),score=7.90 TRINITY_DN45394_c0_g1_i1:270-689(-)
MDVFSRIMTALAALQRRCNRRLLLRLLHVQADLPDHMHLRAGHLPCVAKVVAESRTEGTQRAARIAKVRLVLTLEIATTGTWQMRQRPVLSVRRVAAVPLTNTTAPAAHTAQAEMALTLETARKGVALPKHASPGLPIH